MSKLHVLVEHATGYGVFKVKEFEEIGMILPQLESSINDVSRFKSIVQLVSFSPFKTALAALENINAISEGILPDDLHKFLDITVPKSKKVVLGVIDAKLAAAITEAIGIQCTHIGVVPELMRGLRTHFHHLVKGLSLKGADVAQLGLGHAYSRAKIKFNVHRVDNMIIQSIALLDQLDKDINTFSMRIREWYSYHFPELVKIVPENRTYAKLANFIKNRKDLSDASLEGLEELTMDSAKAQAILDASKSSMGMDISPIDLLNIELFASRVISLSDYRKQLAEYLSTKMSDVAPNLATLIGDQVGARLIAHAGSLTNLAKYPASTVQILGAEKALFRALKTKGNTPKYGLLFHSTFIGRAGTKNKGRISRYLANKCSIASRIDCFTEIPNQVFGGKLKQQVEDRLKFYENGDIPKKNIEVMKEAIEEVNQIALTEKKKRKKRKRTTSEPLNGSSLEESIEFSNMDVSHSSEPPKKKKKKLLETDDNFGAGIVETSGTPKKKKKSLHLATLNENALADGVHEESVKKKKKKKKSEADV